MIIPALFSTPAFIQCSLKRYDPHYCNISALIGRKKQKQLQKIFIWESELVKEHRDGCDFEFSYWMSYQPPMIPGRIRRLFAIPMQERNDHTGISLELTIRNLTKDKDLPGKLRLGTRSGNNYFIGDCLGGLFGQYHGENIRLDFTELLCGEMIFGIPLFDWGGGWGGGGMPRVYPSFTHATQPFEGHLRTIVPKLAHSPNDYSISLGEEISLQEAIYFRRYIEQLKEFLGLHHQVDQGLLPSQRIKGFLISHEYK